MRKHHSTNNGVMLATAMLFLVPVAAVAQATVPGMQPPAGMLATSPLDLQATRPVGIPLGSTEITTPGISPINPAQSTTQCAAGNASSSGALFDGGGLPGISSTNCAGGTAAVSPLSSTPTVGRVGIPLGAAEISGAGISPAVPVPGPTSAVGTTPIDGSGNP